MLQSIAKNSTIAAMLCMVMSAAHQYRRKLRSQIFAKVVRTAATSPRTFIVTVNLWDDLVGAGYIYQDRRRVHTIKSFLFLLSKLIENLDSFSTNPTEALLRPSEWSCFDTASII